MRQLFEAETLITAAKGAVGITATTSGAYVSLLPQVEAWLRIISLLMGIVVGLATLVSIIRNQKTKAAVPPPKVTKNDSKKQS